MINIVLSYLVCIPAAVLCILPVKDKLRYRAAPTFAAFFAFLFILIGLSAFVTWKCGLRENDLLIPLLIICFIVYHFSFRVPFAKCLALFTVVIALMSIITNFAAYFDAARNPSAGLDSYNLEFCIMQIAVSIIVTLLLAYPFTKYGKFFIEQTVSSIVWYAVTMFSFTIILTNLAILPIDYYVFRDNKPTPGILIVMIAQTVGWMLMLMMLYTGISSTLMISEMREQNKFWLMMESQFQSQQKYIRASEKTRHDFRHSIMTLAELYNAGDMDALGEYLNQYVKDMPQNEVSSFCSNAALNAMLNFYDHDAKLNHISLTMRVKLPEKMPISDVDLCSMVGNILENAVIACQKSEEKNIQLSILSEDSAQLYIVAVNSFNGVVRFKDGEYMSFDQDRTGIGLRSIKNTAQKYGGEAQFSHEGKLFYSNVAIPL